MGFSYRLTGYEDNTGGCGSNMGLLNLLVEEWDIFYWPETPRASSQVFILYAVSHGIPEWFCRGHA